MTKESNKGKEPTKRTHPVRDDIKATERNMARDRLASIKKGRLQFPPRPGYVRRAVSLQDGRFQEKLNLGYTVAQKDYSLDSAPDEVGDNSFVFTSNRRTGERSVVMEIPEELYMEYKIIRNQERAQRKAEMYPTEGEMSIERKSYE